MFPRRGALKCAPCFSVGALLAAPAFDSDPPDQHQAAAESFCQADADLKK